MKKKLKNYPFILLILLSLYSCLNEDVVNKMEHHHKYGINTVSINDIPSIITPIEKFNKNYFFLRSNINGYKTAKFENLNLNLDLDNILQLNENQYNSYSIRILVSETEDQYYFENLHIIEKDTLTYSFITKWYPENPNIKFELKTFSGIMKKYDLQYNLIAQYDFINGNIQSQQNNQATGKYTLECDLISYCGCSGEPWCGCNGDYQCRWVVSYACYLANDTTGGGNNGGNNNSGTGGTSGGGGGSSQNNSDNNPFVPNPPEELDEEINTDTPCQTLKKQTVDNANFAHKLDSLKQRVLTTTPNHDTTETMVSIEREANNYIYKVSTATASINGLTIVSGSISNLGVATIHNHPVNSIPIFSYADIVNYYDNYNYVHSSRKNEYTDYLVCFNNTTYALRMENVSALDNLFAGLDLNTTHGRTDAENEVKKIQKRYGLNTNQQYTQAMAEDLFMNIINDPSMGGGSAISLYRKDADGWGKLVKNGNAIQKVPCTY